MRGAIPPFPLLSVDVVPPCSVYTCCLKKNVSYIAGIPWRTKKKARERERVIGYIQNFHPIVDDAFIPCHRGAGTLLC
jgi:hypothetical protein